MRTLTILLVLLLLAAGCAVYTPYDAYGPYYEYPYYAGPVYGYYGPYPYYYGHWYYRHDFDRGRWHARR